MTIEQQAREAETQEDHDEPPRRIICPDCKGSGFSIEFRKYSDEEDELDPEGCEMCEGAGEIDE